MRSEDGNLKKDIFFGKAPGRRGRGRSPTRWSDTIRAWMESVVGAAKEAHGPAYESVLPSPPILRNMFFPEENILENISSHVTRNQSWPNLLNGGHFD